MDTNYKFLVFPIVGYCPSPGPEQQYQKLARNIYTVVLYGIAPIMIEWFCPGVLLLVIGFKTTVSINCPEKVSTGFLAGSVDLCGPGVGPQYVIDIANKMP